MSTYYARLQFENPADYGYSYNPNDRYSYPPVTRYRTVTETPSYRYDVPTVRRVYPASDLGYRTAYSYRPVSSALGGYQTRGDWVPVDRGVYYYQPGYNRGQWY